MPSYFEFSAKINNLKAILISQSERTHSLKKKGDNRHVPQNIDAKEERFSIECGKTKTKVITTANKKKGYYSSSQWEVKVKRNQLTIGLALYLIGWESGASFLANHMTKWIKKTKQRRITFDTRWKIALLRCGLFLNCNRFFVFFNTFPRSPVCLKIPKRQEVALMMSNEGTPPTSNLDGKRKRWEKTWIQREKIGVVEGAEEKVREESPISIREQILDQKGEVEKG